MDNMQFDELWERAEVESHAARLAAGYPAWRSRRRTAGMAVMALLIAGAALPMMVTGRHQGAGYGGNTVAYCNCSDITDRYWTDMAEELLLS